MTEIPVTPPHPIEKFPGLSKRVTLPGSKIVAVLRKVDVQIITLDNFAENADSRELLEVASKYAQASGKQMADGQPASMMKLEALQRGALDMLRRQRSAVLRESVVAPTLDELREMYGGRADSADLGMGPDFSFLMDEANAFNTKAKAGDADSKEEAQDFPGQVGGSTAPDGESVRQTPL